MNAPNTLSPVELVQGQLDAYNAQDVEAFCSFYAEDAVLGSYSGGVLAEGLQAIRERHVKLFADFPQNQAKLLNRIAFGNFVVDHEDVERSPGGESFQVAPIYTIAGGKIARVDFVR